MQLFFEQKCVGAEVNVLFARDQAFHDLVDLRVHQRFAAGNRDHGRAAFIHGFQHLFRAHVHFEHMSGILNFAAARAGQIAAEERLEHEDERIALASGKPLPEHVAGYGPHLRNGHTHPVTPPYRAEILLSHCGCGFWWSWIRMSRLAGLADIGGELPHDLIGHIGHGATKLPAGTLLGGGPDDIAIRGHDAN